jgi:hypothetical protein
LPKDRIKKGVFEKKHKLNSKLAIKESRLSFKIILVKIKKGNKTKTKILRIANIMISRLED